MIDPEPSPAPQGPQQAKTARKPRKRKPRQKQAETARKAAGTPKDATPPLEGELLEPEGTGRSGPQAAESDHAAARAREGSATEQPGETASVRGSASPETDPRKLEIRFLCWFLHVKRFMTYEKISAHLKASQGISIDRHSVSHYVKLEAKARADETRDDHDLIVQRSIANYENVLERYRARMDEPGAKGDEGRYIIMAQERLDSLYGLDAPLKIKDETPADHSILKGLPPAAQAALLRMVAARKKALEEGVA
jgi:hypothetical protein